MTKPATRDSTEAMSSLGRRSAVLLLFLHRMPRWLPPIGAAACLVAGLATHGPLSGGLLVLLAVFLLWLALLSWPRIGAQGRVLRIVVIAAIVVFGVFRAVS